jgi:DnaJ-class molecular chaperone
MSNEQIIEHLSKPRCGQCGGSGHTRYDCSKCYGTGMMRANFPWAIFQSLPCDYCDGHGKEFCAWCKGSGMECIDE